MSRKRRPWRAIAAALLLAAVVAFVVHKVRGPQVPVLLASRGPLVHRVVATGKVLPPARIHLGPTTISRVVLVNASEGDHVKAGDILIQIDDAEAKAQVAQARAAVAQAQAKMRLVGQVTSRLAAESMNQASTNLEQAERQFKRLEALLASGAVAQEQLDDARRSYDNARSQHQSAIAQVQSTGPAGSEYLAVSASVTQAQASLAGALARLAQTRMVAPANALVLSRSAEPGDVVQPGKVLMVLAKEGETQLVVTPDEKNLPFLHLGQAALASADAFPDQRFDASVAYIAPSVDPDRGTVEVKLKVDKPPAYLRADMTVSIDVEVGRRPDVLVLPIEGVRDPTSDRPYVLLVDGGQVSLRSVKTGVRGESVIEIIEGLRAGDAVIPASAGPVAPGARVRPKPVPQETPGAV
jgi:HlyD family secretion protein